MRKRFNQSSPIQIVSDFRGGGYPEPDGGGGGVRTKEILLSNIGYTVSVLGLDSGYMVKYTPPPEGVPEGEAEGNS